MNQNLQPTCSRKYNVANSSGGQLWMWGRELQRNLHHVFTSAVSHTHTSEIALRGSCNQEILKTAAYLQL
jgi:hypothetical protein